MIRSSLWIAGLVACLAVPGCRDDRYEEREPTQQDVLSSSRLEVAPLAVRTAFRRDYPDVTVSEVETHSPQDGPLLYIVTFYQGGRARSASYTQDGALFRVN